MKGFFEQDEDSHWYFIPNKLLPEFERLKSLTEGKDYMDDADTFDEFENKFSEYRTGGGINDIEVQRGSIKRDPKVERPPVGKGVLFYFKGHHYRDKDDTSPLEPHAQIGLIGEGEDFEDGGTVYYSGYDASPYTDVEWWCFIEEIF